MTATRFYFAGTGTPSITPAFNSLWDVTTSAAQRPLWLASELVGVSAANATSLTETSTTNAVDRLCRQHASDSQVTSAHTISGTFSIVVAAFESSTNLNAFLQLSIEVWDSTGTTKRGDLYSGQTQTAESATASDPNGEFPTSTAATRILSGISVTPVAASVGDRIVVSIGYRACNTSATSMGVSFRVDDRSSSSDYALTAGLTTTIRPWIEFSDDIFGSSSPAGDAVLTGTVATTSAGVVGASSGASVAATATITDAGSVGKTTSSAIAATATVTASGSVGKTSGANVSATATVTTSGSVVSGLASGAALAATSAATAAGAVGAVGAASVAAVAAITSAGVVGKASGATVAATAAVTAGGRVGQAAGAAITAAASIVAAGAVGLSAGATVSATVTIVGAGAEASVGITIAYWDGTTTQTATLLGWWDGSTVRPATELGWWDGSTTRGIS